MDSAGQDDEDESREKPLVVRNVVDAPDELVFDDDSVPSPVSLAPNVPSSNSIHQPVKPHHISEAMDGMPLILHRLEDAPMELDLDVDDDDSDGAGSPLAGSMDLKLFHGLHGSIGATAFTADESHTIIHPSHGRGVQESSSEHPKSLPALPQKQSVATKPMAGKSSGGSHSLHQRYPSVTLESLPHRSVKTPNFLDFSYGKSLHLLKTKLAAYTSSAGKPAQQDPDVVTAIFLSNNQLGTGDLPFSLFSVFRNLEALVLSFNKLGPSLTAADFASRQHRNRPRIEDASIAGTTKSSSPASFSSSSRSASSSSVTQSPLSAQPPHIDTLLQHFPNLTKLDLRSNRLSSLPPDLPLCSRLRELLMWKNELDDAGIPVESLAPLTRLERLDVSYNALSSVPAAIWAPVGKGFPHLVVLNLSNNNIRDFPPQLLNNCTSLRTLLLSRNQISSLPAPESWDRMGSLDTLDLGGNALSSVHDGLFSTQGDRFRRLERLYLGNNRLANCPKFGTADGGLPLKVLDLSGNPLTAIDRTVFSLSLLESLVVDVDSRDLLGGSARSRWSFPPVDVVARGLKAMKDWLEKEDGGHREESIVHGGTNQGDTWSDSVTTDSTIRLSSSPVRPKETGGNDTLQERTVCHRHFTIPFAVSKLTGQSAESETASGDTARSDTLVLRADKYDVHVDVQIVTKLAAGRDPVEVEVREVHGGNLGTVASEDYSRIGAVELEIVQRNVK